MTRKIRQVHAVENSCQSAARPLRFPEPNMLDKRQFLIRVCSHPSCCRTLHVTSKRHAELQQGRGSFHPLQPLSGLRNINRPLNQESVQVDAVSTLRFQVSDDPWGERKWRVLITQSRPRPRNDNAHDQTETPPGKRNEGGRQDELIPWLPSCPRMGIDERTSGATKIPSLPRRVTVVLGVTRHDRAKSNQPVQPGQTRPCGLVVAPRVDRHIHKKRDLRRTKSHAFQPAAGHRWHFE